MNELTYVHCSNDTKNNFNNDNIILIICDIIVDLVDTALKTAFRIGKSAALVLAMSRRDSHQKGFKLEKVPFSLLWWDFLTFTVGMYCEEYISREFKKKMFI